MSGGVRTDERPSGSLIAIALDRFGARIDPDERGWKGEESVGWRAETADGPVFVQRFPRWRSVEELGWCNLVARAAETHADEVVSARASADGTIVFESEEGPFCVFPFLEGVHPERGHRLADSAAELLARIHRGLAEWHGAPRPHEHEGYGAPVGEPLPILVDPALDRWELEVASTSAPTAPIHGDFYAGNLLAHDGHIVGVIDWLEARIEHQVQEVSWAAWEFCQNAAGDNLSDDEVLSFFTTYAEAGGPADVLPPADHIPWIRQRLRREATMWFLDPVTKDQPSSYHEGQVRAFHALRERERTP